MSIVNIRVKRGVEIGSNHHLVVMRMDKSKLGLAISKGWMRSMCRLRIEKLQKEETKQTFQAKLQEKYVEQECCSLEEEWSGIKRWLVETAEEVVGRRKCGGRGKSWWGEEISLLVQRKKAAYKKWLNSRHEKDKKAFRELCKIVKEAVKEAKQAAWELFGTELQQDFYNNSRRFWKKVKGEARQDRVVLKDGDGKVLEDGEKVAE